MVAAQWQGEEKSYFRFERFIIFDKKRPGKARPLGHMAEKGRGVLLFFQRGFTLDLQDVLLFHFVREGALCRVSGTSISRTAAPVYTMARGSRVSYPQQAQCKYTLRSFLCLGGLQYAGTEKSRRYHGLGQ